MRNTPLALNYPDYGALCTTLPAKFTILCARRASGGLWRELVMSGCHRVALTLQSACSGYDIRDQEDHTKGHTQRRQSVVPIFFRDALAPDVGAMGFSMVGDALDG